MLGITQGVTEFAPVSSSGHLILIPWIGHWGIQQTPSLQRSFDGVLQLGSFVGAVAYFRKDLAGYIRAWARSAFRGKIRHSDERVAWYLVAAAIPGAVVGVVTSNLVQRRLSDPWLIAVALATFGLVLFLVDRFAREERTTRTLGWGHVIIIGLAQAAAFQPGVSRSGAAITAGRACAMTRESAARFSFLIALPIIGGAGAIKTRAVLKAGALPHGTAVAFALGFLAAAITAYVSVWRLLRYLKRHDFTLFAVYRLALAALVLVVIATGLRAASI